MLNQHKVHDEEERTYESLGNVLAVNFDSYKLYCNSNLRESRWSFFLARRCFDIFIDDETFDQGEFGPEDLARIKSSTHNLEHYFDLLFLDHDLKTKDQQEEDEDKSLARGENEE